MYKKNGTIDIPFCRKKKTETMTEAVLRLSRDGIDISTENTVEFNRLLINKDWWGTLTDEAKENIKEVSE